MHRLSLVIIALLFASSAASGQTAQPGQSTAPPAQQRPSRDTSARQGARAVGTGSLTGQVVAIDNGRAISRARLLLTSSSGQADPIATVTDSDGRYTFSALPAGTYTVSASKAGYVSLGYGASRPNRPGKRITVGQGQQVRDIDIRLPRGSVLTGHVYDETGEPVVNAQIRALRFQYLLGERRALPVGSGETDDRGQYRIFGLTPGTYLVAASVPDWSRRAAMEDRPDPSLALGYGPAYYPGVGSMGDASPIVLGVQQEATNLDFSMQLVPTARVSGMVVGDSGGGAMVLLMPDEGRGTSGFGSPFTARVNQDGTFVVTGVPPGRYVAVARGGMGPAGRGGGGRPTPLTGQQAVSVAGQDVIGVTITLGPGATLNGTVSAESGTPTREELARVRVSLRPLSAALFGPGQAPGAVQADGTFSIQNVPAGPALLTVQGLRTPWALKAIYVNGRDINDTPLDIRNNQVISGVQVVLTNKPSEVTGSVLDAEEKPVTDCYVIAFASDSTQWQPMTRAIQAVKPDETGTYSLRNLPSGNYLVIALTDVDEDSWYDPSVLEGWRNAATSVSVTDGETKSLSLKIAG